MTWNRAVEVAKAWRVHGVPATATWRNGRPIVKVAIQKMKPRKAPRYTLYHGRTR